MPDLRDRLARGDLLFGTLLTLPSPDVAEVVAAAGFDWLFVDAEHGPFDAATLLAVLRAAAGTPCLVRTPPGDEAAIARALDAGAAGVIVPQVHTAAAARRAVWLAHFPPAGGRGVGVTRASGYGSRAGEYVGGAARATTVVVQAESAEAVANVAEIARVPGVDAVLVGPNDLAASLGHAGSTDHPEVGAAIGRVLDECRAAGRRTGIYGRSADAVRPWVARGATLVVVGADALLLGAAARAARASLDSLAPPDARPGP